MMKLADKADQSDRYVVERADGLLLYGSNDLSMARAVFAVWKERRPYGRYLLRRNVEVLERWPTPGLASVLKYDGSGGAK